MLPVWHQLVCFFGLGFVLIWHVSSSAVICLFFVGSDMTVNSNVNCLPPTLAETMTNKTFMSIADHLLSLANLPLLNHTSINVCGL